MSVVAALHRWLAIGAILLAGRGMSLSISRSSPVEKQLPSLGGKMKDVLNVTGKDKVKPPEIKKLPKLGDNVKIYEPKTSKPAGSLILLMGIGGDHSWTMSQWWYLDTTWPEKQQEWCCKDPMSYLCTCWFDDNDRASVQRLRDNLRIVDAVGKIWYREGTSWYKYQYWPDGPPVESDHNGAVADVFNIIEHEYQILGSYKRIAIAGMSQGADLALSVGVRFPHNLGMVVAQRGYLQDSHNLTSPGTPFVISGGDKDELVTVSQFQGSCASLRSMKSPAFLHTHTCYGKDWGETWGCHGSFSKTEWKLLINSFSLMLYPVHERHWEDQISHLTLWSSCGN